MNDLTRTAHRRRIDWMFLRVAIWEALLLTVSWVLMWVCIALGLSFGN